MNPLFYNLFIGDLDDRFMVVAGSVIIAFACMYFATVAVLWTRDKITELREKFRGRK